MAFGLSGKLRLGMATKQGMPKFSRKDSGVVYKQPDKIVSPTSTKHPISGASKQSGK